MTRTYEGLTRHGAIHYLREAPPPLSRYVDSGRYRRIFPPDLSGRDPNKMIPVLMRLGAPCGPMDEFGADVNPEQVLNKTLPAGFTYLGQFIAHDLTYDPTSSLQRQHDPESIRNYRTPSMDLDSIYGGGPVVSPHLYQRHKFGYFLIEQLPASRLWPERYNDLPRNSECIALLADPRNDENVILSQLTLAFLMFHNYVMDRDELQVISDPFERFTKAQEIVRWHYQWIVLHQYLRRLVGRETWKRVLGEGHLVTERLFFQASCDPYIPVEFSVAMFRFGHSQIRPFYDINAWPYRGKRPFLGPPIFTPNPDPEKPETLGLSGGVRVAGRFVEWDRFFDLNRHTDQEGFLQLSRLMDTHLVHELFELPRDVLDEEPKPLSLAQRDLLRHVTFSLPSGQEVAAAMRARLGDMELLPDDEFRDLEAPLRYSTPLWFYVLREAFRLGVPDDEAMDSQRAPSLNLYGDKRRNQRLGPVGGRIVAEVVIGLLEDDPRSFLRRQPDWRPWLVKGSQHFGIEDLLELSGAPRSPEDVILLILPLDTDVAPMRE